MPDYSVAPGGHAVRLNMDSATALRKAADLINAPVQNTDELVTAHAVFIIAEHAARKAREQAEAYIKKLGMKMARFDMASTPQDDSHPPKGDADGT